VGSYIHIFYTWEHTGIEFRKVLKFERRKIDCRTDIRNK